jgi:hypothetical protein
MPVEFPRSQVVALQELAERLLDSRKAGGPFPRLARDLLLGFFDVCVRTGLDRVLVDLAQALPPLDPGDRAGLADHEPVSEALTARLGASKLDDGGPRNAKPRQVVDCLLAALELTVVAEPDRSIAFSDDVRHEVAGALASVVDVELAVPQIRDAIIADAQARCAEAFHAAFAKVTAQLDDRGLHLNKQPKVPIDAMHAVQQALFAAREAVFGRIAGHAIDGARDVLARTSADAAARIDLPITLRATPREVAILRVCDTRTSKTPAKFAQSLLDSLGELARLTWRPAELPVHPYAASRTFAVGDLIEHPKFGRGTVISRLAARIDVEFPDGKRTLAHAAARS